MRANIVTATFTLRLNALTTSTSYTIYNFAADFKPRFDLEAYYTTQTGKVVKVQFTTACTLVVVPMVAITSTTEVLLINETWIQ